jgi:hypothetical protein
MGVEREAKLALVGEGRAELFSALLTSDLLVGCTAIGFRRLLLDDEYYDLPGEPLVERDSALRLRRCDEEGEHSMWLAFKGPAGERGASAVARVELEAEWSPAFLTEILAQVRSIGVELDARIVPDASSPRRCLEALGLHRIQARRTDRRATDLSRSGAVIAELVLDSVDYRLEGFTVLHREIEIEARGETGLGELERLAAILIEEYPGQLLAWPWSKTALGRTLEELAEAGTLEALLAEGAPTPAGYERLAQVLPVR